MYIAELLEVAIGLVFVWLGLALACMGVQEWIASLFKFRARDLEKAIRGMLEEPPENAHVFKRLWASVERIFGGLWAWVKCFFAGVVEEDNTLVGKLYDHQLIRALAKPGKKPSYIPARTFALALFDVAMTAGTDASVIGKVLDTWNEKLEHLQKEGKIPPEVREAGKKALGDLIKLVGKTSDKTDLLARLKTEVERIKAQFTAQYPNLGPVLNKLLDELLQDTMLEQITWGAVELAAGNRQAVQGLKSLTVGAEAYVKEGEKALAVARTNTETWFNDTMDRLTGWYKRRAQVIGVILGLGFAVVLNVDSVVIATTLWREPTLRQALVAQAEKLELPKETEAAAPEGEPEATAPADKIEGLDPAEAIEEFSARFEGLRLPMGWMTATLSLEQQCTWPWSPADETVETVLGAPIGGECWVPLDAPESGIPRGDWGYGLPKILGWLISGLAAAQGAPFWFDVLKKLTNVRSAGKNPAEEEEKEKKG